MHESVILATVQHINWNRGRGEVYRVEMIGARHGIAYAKLQYGERRFSFRVGGNLSHRIFACGTSSVGVPVSLTHDEVASLAKQIDESTDIGSLVDGIYGGDFRRGYVINDIVIHFRYNQPPWYTDATRHASPVHAHQAAIDQYGDNQD